MGLGEWVRNWMAGFRPGKEVKLTDGTFPVGIETLYRELALDSCIDIIANCLASCEFKTFRNGKPERGLDYYLLNVKPNQNQNASTFFKILISKLLHDNECLVVMYNDNLYIAEDYARKEYALWENTYYNVRVGNFIFDKKVFHENEVLFFQLAEENIVSTLKALYSSYGELLASAQQIYKRKNVMRVVLGLDSLTPQDAETQQALQELYDTHFKNWFRAESGGSVLPLPKNMTLSEIANGKAGTKQDSRDIRALIDDYFDFTAMALHIPVGLARGQTVGMEEQMDTLISIGLKPVAKVVQTEFNAKMYPRDAYLAKNYAVIDLSKIKHMDISKLATAADKLFSSAVNNINDNLEMLDREPKEGKIFNEHFVTKNYQRTRDLEKEGE